MSLTSKLFEGKLSPQDFVVQAAADLQKDFAIFVSLPGSSNLIQWALGELRILLSSKLSATLVDLIVNGVTAILAGSAGVKTGP